MLTRLRSSASKYYEMESLKGFGLASLGMGQRVEARAAFSEMLELGRANRHGLITGATGTVGSALLRRLTADGALVRCLVRDPRRLGDQRVRVQIALGDLANPPSFRNALRGVETVVHLAASIRDQPLASIEELNAMATLRLVRAAERAGARRFLFFSAMGARHHSRTRFFRAKALARAAVEGSTLETAVFSPSIVYTPGDPWLTLLERFAEDRAPVYLRPAAEVSAATHSGSKSQPAPSTPSV